MHFCRNTAKLPPFQQRYTNVCSHLLEDLGPRTAAAPILEETAVKPLAADMALRKEKADRKFIVVAQVACLMRVFVPINYASTDAVRMKMLLL